MAPFLDTSPANRVRLCQYPLLSSLWGYGHVSVDGLMYLGAWKVSHSHSLSGSIHDMYPRAACNIWLFPFMPVSMCPGRIWLPGRRFRSVLYRLSALCPALDSGDAAPTAVHVSNMKAQRPMARPAAGSGSSEGLVPRVHRACKVQHACSVRRHARGAG